MLGIRESHSFLTVRVVELGVRIRATDTMNVAPRWDQLALLTKSSPPVQDRVLTPP